MLEPGWQSSEPVDSHSETSIVGFRVWKIDAACRAVFFGSLMLGLPSVNRLHVEWGSVC